jgi:hypothetical protein
MSAPKTLEKLKQVLHVLKNIADFAVLITATIKASEWLAEISRVPWPFAFVFVLACAFILAYLVWVLQEDAARHP